MDWVAQEAVVWSLLPALVLVEVSVHPDRMQAANYWLLPRYRRHKRHPARLKGFPYLCRLYLKYLKLLIGWVTLDDREPPELEEALAQLEVNEQIAKVLVTARMANQRVLMSDVGFERTFKSGCHIPSPCLELSLASCEFELRSRSRPESDASPDDPMALFFNVVSLVSF